jgi:hypothetical protein
MSIELDLLKSQKVALSGGYRKTIVVNCRREIERIKKAHKEAALQHNVLYLLYQKYFKVINETVKELNKMVKDKTEEYQKVYFASASVTLKYGNDVLKPVAEVLFDIDIKEPGTTDDPRKTANEAISDYFMWEVSAGVEAEAAKIVEKI